MDKDATMPNLHRVPAIPALGRSKVAILLAASCFPRLCSDAFARNPPRSKSSPTHFVALRLSQPQLWQRIEQLQEEIWPRAAEIWSTANPHIPEEEVKTAFKATVYPASRFHYSLFVANLMEEARLESAKECLSEWFDTDVQQILAGRSTLDIKLVGLNTLRDEVLYLEPDQESLNLMKAMFHKLEMHFHAAGIQDKFRFRPHATIMKASQLRGKALQNLKHGKAIKKTLRYPREAWAEFNRTLGTYSVKEVQLLDMHSPVDGYFEVEWERRFG